MNKAGNCGVLSFCDINKFWKNWKLVEDFGKGEVDGLPFILQASSSEVAAYNITIFRI